MGILDDVVVNAKSAAETVGRTAEKLMDVSKLKIAIAEVNAEITKRYQALGEYVYDNNADVLSSDAEATGLVSEIGELKVQAESMNRELLGKQNKKACCKCGTLCAVAASFCSVCGAKLAQEEKKEAENKDDAHKDDEGKDCGCGCGCDCDE